MFFKRKKEREAAVADIIASQCPIYLNTGTVKYDRCVYQQSKGGYHNAFWSLHQLRVGIVQCKTTQCEGLFLLYCILLYLSVITGDHKNEGTYRSGKGEEEPVM